MEQYIIPADCCRRKLPENEGDSYRDPITQAIEISIRVGLLILLAVWCLEILRPFVSVVAWAAIFAIAASRRILVIAMA